MTTECKFKNFYEFNFGIAYRYLIETDKRSAFAVSSLAYFGLFSYDFDLI